ncbi:MAG TPA: S8 family serine peptidase, partial [Candidatus Binatia bacterium]|nr:S8 family serine peptidase [Candidatus Binatia bacterium]
GLRTRGDGRIRLTVDIAPGSDEPRTRLRARGLQPTFDDPAHPFVEGWARPADVERIAAVDGVIGVRPTLAPLPSTGSVLSEGDAILLADQARQNFGVTGQGVTVGVVSDSVDGMATAVASGDLPNDVHVLQAGTGAGEGTAMLEIVHDLAPGASLAFYGPATSGDMIAGINALAAAGAGVIVDDLTFFDQPHFEEGSIAQAVNALAAQGVVYVTSSGNFASANADRGHYEGDFADGGSVGGGLDHVHEFAPGDTAQDVVLLPGGFPIFLLQWADPFGSSGNDYDLYVTDTNGTIIAASDDVQNGNDLPFEAIVLNTTGLGTPVAVRVVVNRFAGASRRLELYYASGVTQIVPATPDGSIAGHANASGAITVGTINAGDPGHDTIAPYSSRGPCDLFFPAPEVRDKPEITGIDGVAVTGAAGFPDPFFGTSAAAPHIAAIAALVLDANPSLSATQVKQVLQDAAVDLGAGGFDFVFGAGRADAAQAVADAGVGTTTTSTTTTATQTTDTATTTQTATSSTAPSTSPSTSFTTTTFTTSSTTTFVVTTTTSLVGSTTTTLGARAPEITSLGARLDGDAVTLAVTAVDSDGDLAAWTASAYDAAGTPLGSTPSTSLVGIAGTSASFTLAVNGFGALPTATVIGLVLRDGAGHESAEVRADFAQPDAGGPRLAAVGYRQRAKTLKVTGSGLARKDTLLEVNGTMLARPAKVNRPGSKATAKGSPTKLNLRAGPNRVRAVVNGLHSNILILER